MGMIELVSRGPLSELYPQLRSCWTGANTCCDYTTAEVPLTPHISGVSLYHGRGWSADGSAIQHILRRRQFSRRYSAVWLLLYDYYGYYVAIII